MVKRDELIKFIYQTIGKELMAKALIKDEVANGVQWLGQDEVQKVALGVSANEEFLLAAVKAGGQFCIFHHGLDTRVWKSRYPLFSQKRLKVIVENKLTVVGLHYALDSHPTSGNNSVIARELGAKIKESLFDEWGFTATFDEPQKVEELKIKCAKLLNHKIFSVLAGPKTVTTIGVASGRGTPEAAEIAEMETKGVELYISGETSEWNVHQMKESGINYFCGGHYATEVFGVRELGKTIKAYFKNKLEVEFIDIPNEI
ncbi:Nif3-like dinuclear metal center hexameric protein [Candidatus Beckwithbacteria bacterium RIFCSPLOWO2_02_FULL_47_23]|uniref:Nif3-like dinuclear metal center hexameric protein n=1 Tax=Candidatus Beckwithbacteria bacterium RIFCSPLOWO2_02_FULL_47_23 TaxID=1797463 RepID=A0A1F5DU36_9BACT|nr:MAG: Nif3-like dinuclear metal center hexameric protein [Candidatus Beckwithbacteria bacterium RIFCSPLOWO2_02_FULL_47_23]